MWWTLLESLKNSFSKNCPQIHVQAGSGVGIENYPSLQIIRDSEKEENLHKGICNLWIDCWVRNDSIDPGEGYAELSNLESLIKKQLWEWVKSKPLDAAIKVNIKGTISDGEEFRPLCGSRTFLEIEWRR